VLDGRRQIVERSLYLPAEQIQVAREMPVQLVDENSDKVLVNGRTNAQGIML
jgi:hypothetical protein